MITLNPEISEQVKRNVPDKALVDPEAPVDAERLREILVPEEVRKMAAGRFMLGGLVLFFVLALFVIWRWTPLSEWIEVGKLVKELEGLNSTLYGPAIAVATVTFGGLIAIPITLLIVATMLVFGSIEGAAYGVLGSVSGAVLGYVAGQSLGQEIIRKIAGEKAEPGQQTATETGHYECGDCTTDPHSTFRNYQYSGWCFAHQPAGFYSGIIDRVDSRNGRIGYTHRWCDSSRFRTQCLSPAPCGTSSCRIGSRHRRDATLAIKV